MTRTRADIKIDTITLETGSEGLIRAGQEVVLRVHGGDSNCPSFQCATTSGLVVGSLDGKKLQFLTPSNLPNVIARIQTIKRSCDGGLEDVVVRVREKLKNEIPFEGQAAQQPCSGPAVEDQEEELDLFTKSELVKMTSNESLKVLLDHRIVKHWVKTVAEAQGSEKQSQLVNEALDDPVVAEFVEQAFRSQEEAKFT